MAELVQIWDREILPNLDLSTLLSSLSPKKVGGNVYVRCPHCGEHEAFIKQGKDTIKCNRSNSCGKTTQLLAWLNGGEMPTGKRWVDSIRDLGKTVGAHIPEKAYTPEQIEKYEAKKANQTLLESILEQSQKQLPHALLTAVPYLTQDRGFKADRLHALEFGYYPAGMRAPDDEHKAVLGKMEQWDNRVIFPMRDRFGDLVGLAGRTLTEGEKPKFVKTTGYDINSMVLEGLDVAKKYKHVFVGESTIGMFAFREVGINQMTAVGGSQLSVERWEKLYDWGFESVTLVYDPDKAGQDGMLKSIEHSLDAKYAPEVYVIPGEWLEGMDPDLYLRTKGAEAIAGLFLKCMPVDTFMAQSYAKQHDVKTTLGYRAFLEAAANYLARRSKDPKRALLAWQHFFRDGIAKIIDIDEDFFFDYVLDVEAKLKQEAIKKELDGVQELFRKAAKSNDLQAAKEQLQNAVQSLHAVDLDKQLKPLVRASKRLLHHDRYLKEMVGKSMMGLASLTFPTFDNATSGARGLIAIAGGPGCGKTTFAVDLGIDIIKANPKACLLIVSLEMSEDDILTRLKSRALLEPYDRLLLRNDEAMRDEANYAIRPFIDRVMIIDEDVYPNVNVDLIARDAARLKEETGCDEVVVILDYLQLLSLPAEIERKPELEQDKWLSGQMKRLRRALWPNAVIFISEVTKADGFKAIGLHSLKGSSRIVYAADTVVLINKIEEDDLLDRIELIGKKFKLKTEPSRYNKKKKKSLSNDEAEFALEMFVDEMEKQGKDFVDVSIPKVRGGRRKSFTLVHKHVCSDMKELTHNGEGL